MMLKNICVYCGASEGKHPLYKETAVMLGQLIATQGRRLIYGGGNRGLMGIIANATLQHGGEVFGVIPEKLVKAETAHTGLTQLDIVNDMQSRKSRMSELADAFIALPGGTGTLEEFYEVWTAIQVGYHKKPVALLNVNGFYNKMLAFLHHASEQEFIRETFLKTLLVSDDPKSLLTQMDHHKMKDVERWIKK